MKKKSILRNLLLIIGSNLLSLFLGISISFVLPKIIGSVEDFAYWQLYIFYSGYLGFFLFGFNDGMNLLYAGKKLDGEERPKITAFLFFVLLVTSIFSIIAIIMIILSEMDIKFKITYLYIAINIIIFNINGFSLHLNQILMRFGKYARFNVLERVLFVASFFPLVLINADKYYIFIGVNVLARIIVMILNLHSVRDIVLLNSFSVSLLKANYGFIKQCIVSGFPLTMSAILSMLVITSPRIIVEYNLSLYEYGLFSFAFSSMSIVLQVISALATVLYPTLKTVETELYDQLNMNFKFFVTYVCSAALLLYFFIPTIIRIILPQYEEILSYLNLLFPWIIYQSINSINVSVFYRIARLENRLLLNNLFGVVFIFAVEYSSFLIFGNVESIILSGLLGLAIWTRYNHMYLIRFMNWSTSVYENIDIILVLGFLLITNLASSDLQGFLLYFSLLTIITVITYKMNKSKFENILNLIRR